MKTWATVIWISRNRHWVATRQDDGEGSVFENDESDLVLEDKLLGDWTADGGDEVIFSKELQRSFHIYIQGRFFSWKGALESAKRSSGDRD